MALIKCAECGKQISDKATTCIHCGCPIEKEENIVCAECGNKLNKKDKVCGKCGCPVELEQETIIKKKENMPVIKSWEELNKDEKNRVLHYRKINNELLIGDRANLKSFRIIGLVCLLLSFLGLFFLFIPFIAFAILVAILNFKVIPQQDKEWYERNKERVYKEKYLPLN